MSWSMWNAPSDRDYYGDLEEYDDEPWIDDTVYEEPPPEPLGERVKRELIQWGIAGASLLSLLVWLSLVF